VGVALAACGPATDVTPLVPVQPGAAARAVALMGHGGPNMPASSAAQEKDAGGEGDDEDDGPGTIALSCLEARGSWRALARVPCRVKVTDLDASATGDAPTEIVFANGRVAIDAPAGKYRVTVSRGFEYAPAVWDAEVVAGEVSWPPNEGAMVLRRAVDTHGYLAAALDGAAQTDVEGAASSGIRLMLAAAAPAIEAAKLDDAIATVDAADLDAIDPLADRETYLARLASKRPVAAVGRAPAVTYVRVDDEASPATWSPAREAEALRSLRERLDVLVTTGPFLRVTANGAPIGGVARAGPKHEVRIAIHLECPAGADVDHVTISRASGPSTDLPATCASKPADLSATLEVPADDALVITASAPASATGASAPRAVAGAIWIDADGDGESLGRRASSVPPPPKPPPPPPPPLPRPKEKKR
jgi:hypothetical protein